MILFYILFPEPSGNIIDSYLCWTTVGNYLPTWHFSESWKVCDADLWPFCWMYFTGVKCPDQCAWIQIFCRHIASPIICKGFRTKAAFFSVCMRLCLVCLLLFFVVHIYRNGLCTGIPHPQETSSKLCTNFFQLRYTTSRFDHCQCGITCLFCL